MVPVSYIISLCLSVIIFHANAFAAEYDVLYIRGFRGKNRLFSALSFSCVILFYPLPRPVLGRDGRGLVE